MKKLLSVLLALMILMGAVTALIDPFFHYHKPLPFLQYEIYYQRYQNDGIVRHFDYDTLITITPEKYHELKESIGAQILSLVRI